MLKLERIQQIKDIIYERKQINVATLSQILTVSDATIRNDLEELEQEGFLTRFHGGARINSIQSADNALNDTFSMSIVEYDKNKEELGIIASRLVNEKEWIFLGPGTTSYYIAKALTSRNNIHVLTNNLLVSYILSTNSTINIILLGGRLDNKGLYTIPSDILSELNNVYLSKSFFSVDGADLKAGYTLSDLNVLEIIKAVSTKCEETIFSVDKTKFGQRSFRKLGDLDFAQSVILNDPIPDSVRTYYLEHGIAIHTANSWTATNN